MLILHCSSEGRQIVQTKKMMSLRMKALGWEKKIRNSVFNRMNNAINCSRLFTMKKAASEFN